MAKAGTLLVARDREREASHAAGGSLGATMNQGAAYSRDSSDTLPELMHQGGSTKRGDQSRSKSLRSIMGQ